jgi:fructokinase
MIRIGIDLGGTKIEGIALSEAGEELFRHRIATPQDDYKATLQSIAGLINTVEQAVAETGSIGICTPGSLSPATGLMRNSNSVCMNAKPVLNDLQQILHRDIRIANDANCFALSEATDGAAKNAAVVFGVIIGTGTGAGIVVDKKILVGPNSIAGK